MMALEPAFVLQKNGLITEDIETRAKKESKGKDSGLPGSVTSGTVLAEDLNEKIKNKYKKDKKVGEGAYAVVFAGHSLESGRKVAIKKIKQNTMQSGLAMDAIREVKYLQELQHENIIQLLDVFSSKNQNLSLVLEFLDCDLEMIIKDTRGINYSMADVKSWMVMGLRGLWWCHKSFVLHRDIKPNNLLISSTGVLKLGDFGLARSFSDPYRQMTSNMITRWYRPPELLFGAKAYGTKVDIWSMGLVFAELLLRVPFLAGASDVQQLELICSALGTPTEDNWPGVTQLPEYVVPTTQTNGDKPVPVQGRGYFDSMFGAAGPRGVDLLMGMLVLDPRRRWGAKECLEVRWFTEDPRPTEPSKLPRIGGKVGEEKIGNNLRRRPGWDEGLEGDDLTYNGVGGKKTNGDFDDGGRGKKVARRLFV